MFVFAAKDGDDEIQTSCNLMKARRIEDAVRISKPIGCALNRDQIPDTDKTRRLANQTHQSVKTTISKQTRWKAQHHRPMLCREFESDLIPSALEMLLDYHRLLRIIEEECCEFLDEESLARLVALMLDRIQELEFPAALQIDRAREMRG